MLPYQEFLASKRIAAERVGFTPLEPINPKLLGFQRDIVEWALRLGRAAIFADCGLGKTLMQLEWARHICEHERGDAIILAPLSVARQTQREGLKFGISVTVCRTQADVRPGINVTNYEMLKHFDAKHFVCVVLDEADILAAFMGKTKQYIITSFRGTRFKLTCTATPAPNDHVELGNQADFLDVPGADEMLARWFINDSMEAGAYRLKGHAEADFWRWVASWAVSLSRPSDLGYPDEGFALLPLNMNQEIVNVDITAETDGMLFRMPTLSATTMHKEMRRTAEERAKRVASIIFGAKECGKKSTNGIDGGESHPTQNIKPYSSPGREAETQRSDERTRERTTQPISTSGSNSERANPPSETPGDENDTRQTKFTARRSKNKPETSAQSENGTLAFGASSESPSSNMTGCLPNRAGNARSAERHLPTQKEDDSPLTIATALERFAVSSAQTAIRELASSPTIPKGCGSLPRTSSERPERWVVWCNTDYEQDALEQVITEDFVSIRGSQPREQKEYLHDLWLNESVRILVSKPKVFGHGMNWQHCHKMAIAGLSYSFKELYQAIRRCWRFGQTEEVDVHLVMAETEGPVLESIQRKQAAHEKMKAAMVAAMAETGLRADGSARWGVSGYRPEARMTLPGWMNTKEDNLD